MNYNFNLERSIFFKTKTPKDFPLDEDENNISICAKKEIAKVMFDLFQVKYSDLIYGE